MIKNIVILSVQKIIKILVDIVYPVNKEIVMK